MPLRVLEGLHLQRVGRSLSRVTFPVQCAGVLVPWIATGAAAHRDERCSDPVADRLPSSGGQPMSFGGNIGGSYGGPHFCEHCYDRFFAESVIDGGPTIESGI